MFVCVGGGSGGFHENRREISGLEKGECRVGERRNVKSEEQWNESKQTFLCIFTIPQ